MFLGELVQTIDDLESTVDSFINLIRRINNNGLNLSEAVHSDLLNSTIDYIDKLQAHRILECKYNNSVILDIGNTKLKLSEALELLSAIELKIKTLETFINNHSGQVNVKSTINTKVDLEKERRALNSVIESARWTYKIQ